MRKLLYIFSLLFSLSALAELNVEWIDDNTIVVTGYGYGDTTNETALGSCTNCLAISPAEMRLIKSQISDLLIDTETLVSGCFSFAQSISNRVSFMIEDISGFRRFGSSFPITFPSYERVDFTNYIYSANNTQTTLVKSQVSSPANLYQRSVPMIGYNNGIYDYAIQYVSPELSATLVDATSMLDGEDLILSCVRTIGNIVNGITEESCKSCGGGTNSNNCSSCPCEEQWQALLDYVRHIDDDQHKRYIQLNHISNNVFNIDKQLDSYAKLISGALYNDATIVVDDGVNSWSNVYTTGHSDLYDYNKSNILQRIELLLFGISYNTSTNWGDVTSDVESSVTDVQNNFNDAKTYVQDANDDYTEQVSDLSGKFRALWQSMNFFGAGRLSNFSIAEPSNTFGLYEMDYDFDKSADLSDLQRISRTCFQIFYWSIGIVFMLVFWLKVVTFTVHMSLRVVRFFNMLIT